MLWGSASLVAAFPMLKEMIFTAGLCCMSFLNCIASLSRVRPRHARSNVLPGTRLHPVWCILRSGSFVVHRSRSAAVNMAEPRLRGNQPRTRRARGVHCRGVGGALRWMVAEPAGHKAMLHLLRCEACLQLHLGALLAGGWRWGLFPVLGASRAVLGDLATEQGCHTCTAGRAQQHQIWAHNQTVNHCWIWAGTRTISSRACGTVVIAGGRGAHGLKGS
jgi:hypothetical protein